MTETTDEEIDQIVTKATQASNFLKAISHEGRLMILCHLVTGEKSVTELERLLSARQAAVSASSSRGCASKGWFSPGAMARRSTTA